MSAQEHIAKMRKQKDAVIPDRKNTSTVTKKYDGAAAREAYKHIPIPQLPDHIKSRLSISSINSYSENYDNNRQDNTHRPSLTIENKAKEKIIETTTTVDSNAGVNSNKNDAINYDQKRDQEQEAIEFVRKQREETKMKKDLEEKNNMFRQQQEEQRMLQEERKRREDREIELKKQQEEVIKVQIEQQTKQQMRQQEEEEEKREDLLRREEEKELQRLQKEFFEQQKNIEQHELENNDESSGKKKRLVVLLWFLALVYRMIYNK